MGLDARHRPLSVAERASRKRQDPRGGCADRVKADSLRPVGIGDEIERLWHWATHHGEEPAPPVAGGYALVHEVLDPTFLRERLEQVQQRSGGLLSKEQYAQMYADLDRAAASPVSGASSADGKQAYLPRSPAVSLFQSALTDCIASRFDALVKPVPSDVRSWAEYMLRREVDVFRKFGPCDAGWVETVLSEGIARLSDRPAFPQHAPEVALADDARIVVVGDWGTGLSGAQAVGRQMARAVVEARREEREVHVLHLGDVYYSGWKEEYETRFLPYWPVREPLAGVTSWALNGNHDMYSGGRGYFGYLLRHPLFAAQQGSSHFRLANEHWQLLGLDSAYDDDDLAGGQGAWVKQQLRASDRRTMLLTHHEPFSRFATGIHPPLLGKLAPAFEVRPVDAWLWGHEHLCCVYDRQLEPYVNYGSCIGHGGVPMLAMEGGQREGVAWTFSESTVRETDDRWQRFGFAVLDFKGPDLSIAYCDDAGELGHTEQV